MSLLIVEDDSFVRQFLVFVLQPSGVRVLLAGSRSEALTVLRENPDVSAVLLDVQLPDGDGPSTLLALREIVPGLPAVYLTGDPSRLPLDHGAVDVLTKPFHPDLLNGLLQRLMPASFVAAS